MSSAAVAVIQFALTIRHDDGWMFLRWWNEGEFDRCRKWYPEAPEAVYIGADPMHPLTVISIGDDPAFNALMEPVYAAARHAYILGNDHNSGQEFATAEEAVIKYIDARYV